MEANKKFMLLCDGKKEKEVRVRDRCCPGECIGGPGSPITRSNPMK